MLCQACNKNTLNKLTQRRGLRYWQSECLRATADPGDFRLPWAPCRRAPVYSWPRFTKKNPIMWHVFLRHMLCAGTISLTPAWGEHRFKCRGKGPREHCYCCWGLDESRAQGEPSAPRVTLNSFVDEAEAELHLRGGHKGISRNRSKAEALGGQVKFGGNC